MPERRQYPRAKITWPVTIETPRGPLKGETKDVSPAGLFIRCPRPLRLHETFKLSIYIHSLSQSLEATAEVVWSNIYGPDDEISPRGMGVRFVTISNKDRRYIASAVLDQCKSAKMEPVLLRSLQTLVVELENFDSDTDSS